MRKRLLGALAIWMAGATQLFAQSLPPIPEIIFQVEPSSPNSGSSPATTPAMNFGRFPGMDLTFSGCAKEPNGPCREVTDCSEDFFTGWNLELISGFYHSPVNIGPKTARYNFVPVTLRIGKITDCGCDSGLLRGNLEPILEISGAPVVAGVFGSYYVGASFILRYNFVQPDLRLVPYFQLGAGITDNDGYRDLEQRALGEAVEFLLHVQFGVRYFINDRLALNIEGGLLHISNAGLAPRNLGVNALGGTIGFTYFLGPRANHF